MAFQGALFAHFFNIFEKTFWRWPNFLTIPMIHRIKFLPLNLIWIFFFYPKIFHNFLLSLQSPECILLLNYPPLFHILRHIFFSLVIFSHNLVVNKIFMLFSEPFFIPFNFLKGKNANIKISLGTHFKSIFMCYLCTKCFFSWLKLNKIPRVNVMHEMRYLPNNWGTWDYNEEKFLWDKNVIWGLSENDGTWIKFSQKKKIKSTIFYKTLIFFL